MHIPTKFKENDLDSLYKFIQDYPLGTLIISGQELLDADHIPFYLKKTEAGDVLLQSHIAKANQLWKICSGSQEVLVIFHGPNAYISPNYYASKKDNGKVVPTWNYAVVHVRGRVDFKHEASWIMQNLEEVTGSQEAHQSKPWSINDAPAEFTQKLAKAVVGVEVRVEDIVGNFKLSQNKSTADYVSVLAALSCSNRQEDIALLEQMQKR